MEEVLRALHELPASSVYGAEFDALFEQVKQPKTVSKLLEVDIPDCGGKIRLLMELVTSIASFKTTNIIENLRNVQSIAKWGDFI